MRVGEVAGATFLTAESVGLLAGTRIFCELHGASDALAFLDVDHAIKVEPKARKMLQQLNTRTGSHSHSASTT